MNRRPGHGSSGRRRTAAKKNIARIFEEKTPILRAVERAAHRAIQEHARANAPVVVYRNGRTVLVSAKQLLRKKTA